MKNCILIALIGITIGIFQVFLSTAKDIDGSVEVSKKEPSKSTTMGESVINDGTKRSFTVIPMYDAKTEALDVNSISCKGDGGATWIRPDGLLLTAVEIPTLDSAGDFAVIIKGAINSTVKGTRFSPAPKGWKFDGIGEYHIKCKYDYKVDTPKIPWNPIGKNLIPYNRIDMDQPFFTFSCYVNGQNTLDDLGNTLDQEAAKHPYKDINGNEIPGSVTVGEFKPSGILIQTRKTTTNSACPICKSKEFRHYKRVIEYQFKASRIKVPKWNEEAQAGRTTKSIWDKYIQKILEHENLHKEDFKNMVLNQIKECEVNVSCCKNCNPSQYGKVYTLFNDSVNAEFIRKNNELEKLLKDEHQETYKLRDAPPNKGSASPSGLTLLNN